LTWPRQGIAERCGILDGLKALLQTSTPAVVMIPHSFGWQAQPASQVKNSSPDCRPTSKSWWGNAARISGDDAALRRTGLV
jgi:hypothetical protein